MTYPEPCMCGDPECRLCYPEEALYEDYEEEPDYERYESTLERC